MSHAVVYAIIKPNTDVESEIERIMSPFDENLSVESYVTDCWCIGDIARRDAEAELTRQMGSWDDARERYRTKYPDRDNNKWVEEYYNPRHELETRLIGDHPLRNSPVEDCDNCNGTGKYETTQNPRSKWDWWVVGGRWDGAINQLEYKDSDHHSIERNSCLVRDVKEIPFALVAYDGVWLERGRLGWFGCVFNEKSPEDWDAQWQRIKQVLGNYLAVAVDYHI
jgi:hypothetical protein